MNSSSFCLKADVDGGEDDFTAKPMPAVNDFDANVFGQAFIRVIRRRFSHSYPFLNLYCVGMRKQKKRKKKKRKKKRKKKKKKKYERGFACESEEVLFFWCLK